MKNKWFIIRMLLSLTIMVVLLYTVGLSEVWAALKKANPVFAGLVVLLAFSDRLLVAFKWNILVRALDIHVPFKEAFRSYMASSFVGMFFPTSVGGDILRLFIVGADKSRRGEIAATIVVERILALVALFLLLAVSSSALYFMSVEHVGLIVILSVVILLTSSSVVWLSFHKLPLFVLNMFPAKIAGILQKIALSYQRFKNHGRALAAFFALSFVAHLFPIACNYFVAVSLGINVSPLAFFVVIPVVLVFARLPISLDGIGIQEWLYMVLFPLAGMTQAEALSLGLLARVLTIIALLPGAWMFMLSPARKEISRTESSGQPG